MRLPAWTIEPGVVVPLAVTAVLYAAGVGRLWRNSRSGGGISRAQCACFASGWMVLSLALTSPLHEMGETLFSAHMLQHELLIAVASPLLVLGRPLLAFVWALPRRSRGDAGRISSAPIVAPVWKFLTAPLTAFVIHSISIWIWHAPAFYQAAIAGERVHAAQHTTFLFAGCLFWWTILSARGERGGRGRGIAAGYLFATILVTGALGALLTSSTTLWYPAYSETTLQWGLAPLEDQQLGGLIMWVLGSLPYAAGAIVLLSEWLRESRLRAAALPVKGASLPAGDLF